MKRYIIWMISLIILIAVPITLFNVIGFHYDLGQLDAETITEDSKQLLITHQSPTIGTSEHKTYQEVLVNRLEALNFDVEVHQFKQLGPVNGSESFLTIGNKKIKLYSAQGGRSTGGEFSGAIVIQNLSRTYEDSYVEGKFVLSSGFGDLSDLDVERLYDAGCKGIIIGNGNYRDGFTKLNYATSDGKLLPIVYTSEEDRDYIIDLAKASQIKRQTVSFGTSYTGVDFFDAGSVEAVQISVDKTIDIIEGSTIIARMGDHSETIAFGTNYDGDGSGSDTMLYQNTTSVATLLEIAKRVNNDKKAIDKNVMLLFFDGGLLEQSGVQKFRASYSDTNTSFVFLDRIGLKSNMLLSASGDSQFMKESFTQYDLDHILVPGDARAIYYNRMDSPGAEYLKFNEKAVIITSDFTDNSMRYFSGEIPLESERIEPLLNVLDQYIKAEIYNDAYPEFMNNSEWQFIIVLVILMMVLISVHQLKFIPKIKLLYYSVPYTIFKGFCNALFVVVFTLFMILSITILPNYFNLEGGNFNYNFYALWRSIILTVRGFFEHGLGMTSTGVPYSEIIIMQGKTTFGLLTIALLIATSVGFVIGLLSSYLKKSHDKQQSMLVILGLSIPETVIIMVMLLSLGPIMSVPFIQASLTTTHFRTIIMPLIVLSLVPTIYVSRTVYMTLVEETKKKYITSLKAKGVKKDRIYTHHLSKVAFNKIMNHFPIILAINISTMIICERMFGLTGLFSTFIDAMISGEFLFCLGIVLSLMGYYYIVVLTSQTLSGVLMPRSGGAYEVE